MNQSRNSLFSFRMMHVLLLMSVVMISIALPALSQETDQTEIQALDGVIGGNPDSSVATDESSDHSGFHSVSENRAALSREIMQMQVDISDIARFSQWQDDLEQIGRIAPDEAMRQRRPMKDCLESVLEPICDHLTGLFKPETE